MTHYDDYATVHRNAGLYRSRDGMIAGVLAGVADYFDLSVFWTRVLAIIFVLCTGFWPGVFLYVVAALLMKREPYYRW